MASGWEPWAGRLAEGGRRLLGGCGRGLAEGLRRTTSERGSRQMDMEAEPGSSGEALLSDESYAVAAVVVELAAAAVAAVVAAADQTAYPDGCLVP